MDLKKVKIIAVAAVPGGGKTYVVTRLKNSLNNSSLLHFDDYDIEGPKDICEWIEKGADYNEWNLEPIVNDIEKILKDSKSQVEYLLLDYPFAYKNDIMSRYIDYTIFIDSPLDIALARRILRDLNDLTIEDVEEELTDYLSNSRIAYLEMIKNIKPDSDFVVDGSLDVDDIVYIILDEIEKYHGSI